MENHKLLYEGKAKKIFETDKAGQVLMEFKDSLTAFNALKKGEFKGKGELNCQISTLIFHHLTKNGIAHHWIETRHGNQMLVQKTEIIPLEVVVRNFMAGSLAKKLGQSEGAQLAKPVVEFYFKKDELNDPFVNDDQIVALGWADQKTLDILKAKALEINKVLSTLFQKVDLKLIDFKTEFGRNQKGEIILSDEISPDCMRLWDQKTNKKLDKDRFRQDLGDVAEAYNEVFQRIEKGVGL
jgi:phosphoribosylaminoimidazole-succinocarboxamide synthase